MHALPSDSSGLVHTRTLLVRRAEPVRAVAEMVRPARPGGQVASLGPDCEYDLCCPPCPAITRICEIFPLVFARNGADPQIGRRVPELLRQAGLTDVQVDATVEVLAMGHTRRTLQLDLARSMHPRVVELGLAGDAELDELDAAGREHILRTGGHPHVHPASANSPVRRGRFTSGSGRVTGVPPALPSPPRSRCLCRRP